MNMKKLIDQLKAYDEVRKKVKKAKYAPYN